MSNESCETVQSHTYESVDLPPIQILFSALYTMIWVAAFVGNLLVLYVISVAQITLNVRSVFIGCLAISDLLMSITSLPITAITIFTRIWIFPSVFCKLIGIFQGGSIFVSSFTLTAIAIDRCFLIARPNKQVITYNKAILVCIGIWTLGYSLALPTGLFTEEHSYPEICGTFCEETWPDYSEVDGRSNQRRIYGLTVLILQFGIPAVISSLCYWMISRVMSTQIDKRTEHSLLPECKEKLVSRKNRANRMMIVMVLGFIFAWIPLNAINLYRDLMTTFSVTPWFSTIFAFCHVTAMMSAVLNPVIYSWFNPQFRSAIQTILQGRSSKRSSATCRTIVETNTTLRRFSTARSAALLSDCHQPGDQFL